MNNDDLDRITEWTAQKLGAVAVIVICDGGQTYRVRNNANRMLVADKLREMAREVENT